jgi:hypothetical protein
MERISHAGGGDPSPLPLDLQAPALGILVQHPRSSIAGLTPLSAALKCGQQHDSGIDQNGW